jgi:cobalt-precorrin 5A hydrolase
MDVGEALMVAGIGCRAGVSGEQVEAAIVAALAALRGRGSGTPGPAVHDSVAALAAIATPAAKAIEPGIQAAAAARGVPLLAISQPDLESANPATVTRSARSMAAMNVHSVAEAAALAGATALAGVEALAGTATLVKAMLTTIPRLLQPRVAVGPVTCALADTTPP